MQPGVLAATRSICSLGGAHLRPQCCLAGKEGFRSCSADEFAMRSTAKGAGNRRRPGVSSMRNSFSQNLLSVSLSTKFAVP